MPVASLSTRRPLAVALVLVAVAALAGGALNRWRQSPPTSRYAAAHDGLCSSLAEARDGDLAGARRMFTDEVHGPLHRLAEAAAAAGRREEAARLLEAKESVERAAPGGSASGLATRLEALEAATSRAMDAVDEGAPAGCPR